MEGWVSLFLLYQPSIIFIAFSCQAWHITPAVGKQHSIHQRDKYRRAIAWRKWGWERSVMRSQLSFC